MADETYQKKLESLQKYIPFLVNMMAELKAKGNRQAQLAKIQSLHDMISDSKKKLKIETLSRCEEVLTNIYFKVNPQLRAPKSPPPNSKNLPGIESPRSTPKSPSPLRDVILTKPVNIPTEKVTNETKGTVSRNSPRTSRPKINVYSNVLLNSPSKNRAPPPDMSKPPISLDDLKTLEDDVQQKIADAAFSNKSVDELQEVRKQLQLQLRVDEVTSAMSPEKPKEYVNPSGPFEPTVENSSRTSGKKTKSPKHHHKTHKTKGKNNVLKGSSSSSNSSKNSVKDVDLFGNLLSSIDNKLLEDKKKVKKGDRRSSVTLGKEDSASLSSDTHQINTKKSKESKHKKDVESNKHRRSSIDQMKNVDKTAEKSKAKTKLGNEKPKSETEDQSTDKESSTSIELKEDSTDNDEDHNIKKSDCLNIEEGKTNFLDSGNFDTSVVNPELGVSNSNPRVGNSDPKVDNSNSTLGDSDSGVSHSDPRVSHSDLRISNSDPRVSHSDPRISNSDPRISQCDPRISLSDPRISYSDPRVSKSDPRISNSDPRVSNSDLRISNSDPRLNKDHNVSVGMTSDAVSNSGQIFKRLADKYNPKPKQKTNEPLLPHVDKAVSDNIEKLMKVSPVKPLPSPLEQLSQESRPVQLPDILQKIFSKPLLGDIIPKRLTEPILPLSSASQTRPQNLNILTKPGAINPPEPPILSPPHKPIHFQPPPRFMSPPRSDLGLSPDQIGRSPLLQPPRPVPAPQPMQISGLGPLPSLIPGHGILPAPPMPPNLPSGFMDRGMNMGFGTPRVDFDMPGTPRVDFDMPGTPRVDFDMPCTPRVDFDMPGTPRVDFEMPGTPMPDFDSPRVEFDPPHFLRNDQYNVNRRFMSPVSEQQMPRNVNFLNQGHFNQHPEVNNFIPYESGQATMPFYSSNHMAHQSNMEVPPYMPDQSFYQDRFRWNRDRRPGDPRNYREYKEMKERQEREARVTQEKVMEIKDPRLAPRESHGESFRDPRWSRDSSIEPVIRSKSEVGIRDPRLSKELEKSGECTIDLTNRGRSLDRDNKDPRSRGRSRERFSDSRSRGRENKFESNKFDKMYSRTSRARSRSRSRDRDQRVDDDDDSFVSPLDSLYNAGEKGKTGKGYGFQKFKIPRKPKEGNLKQKDAKREEGTRGSNVNHRRRIIESSDSDDSGTNDVNDSEPITHDSDSEGEQSEEAGKDKIHSIESEKATLVEESKKHVGKPGVDVSRIKVVIKSTDNAAVGIWDSTSKAAEPDDFVSEYDREFASSGDKNKPAKPIPKISKTHKKSLNSKNEGIQREEPSSSEDVVQQTSKLVKADSSKKFDDLSVEANSPVATEPSEADSSKRGDGTITPQEKTSKSDEPSEQNILAHFFENLLKSRNKNDKKSALFSLIETFSDSFEDKEIQKIRKIIKVNEDVIDASDEENDEPTIQNQPSSAETIKESKNTEEQPVVGSTTEEENGIQIASIAEKNAETSETQVNEVTKSSDISEEQLMPETSLDQGLSLEPVMVSVGERIKNRKRIPAPSKQRKKFKSELDLLHEDIQDMFIRDGVLTATGKRMCRILKDDPNVLATNDPTLPAVIADQPKKLRKKPGPKPKTKVNNQEVIQNSLKDMRVVIKKMPDVVIGNSSSGRQLRSQTRLSSYAETDDDTQEVNFGELPFASSAEVGSDKSDLERESADDSEEDKRSENTGDIPKVKVKRRKVPRWASGIIRKKKKKPQQNTSKDNSPERTDLALSEKADDSTDINELEVDKLIEPDKNYYYDYANKRKLDCKLCKYSGHLLTGHYLKEHPQCEVLCSRFSPQVAAEAIEDFASFGETFVNIVSSKISVKYHYCCRMCGYKSFVSPIFFYEHITTHTGEYRHHCGLCEYSSVTSKTMAVHFSAVHPDQEKKFIKTGYALTVIFAYMCGECNFVQLNEKTVEDHANIFHLGEKTTIYKINMSTIVDPQLLAKSDSSLEAINNLPSGSNGKLVTDVTAILMGDNEQLETSVEKEATKRKKSGPKPKAKAQQHTPESEEKGITPVLRKRPGPKSKTLQSVEQKDSVSTEHTEIIPLPTPARKKPGPKSRTLKSKSASSKQTLADNQPTATDNLSTATDNQPTATSITEDGAPRDTPVRKRRRSLEKLIPEDSGDDLDAIITLSSRSSRAAKEKATAKLKTLMENNEGTGLKRRADSEPPKKDQKADTEKQPMENSVRKGQNLTEEEYIDIEGLSEDIAKKEKCQVEEMHPPVVSAKPFQADKDLNVFTCKGDILQEESKKIEEDRLRTMDELNKSIGSRALKLDFTHKLSNRLNEEQRANESSAVKVKEEPKDHHVTCDIDIPIFPQSENEASELPTMPSSVAKGSKSSIISKKPVLEESTVKPSNINFRQNKPNSLFCNMIEKLQAAVEQENVTNDIEPAVEELSDSQASIPSEMVFSIGDLIKATKTDKEISYSCHANNCYVSTKDKMVFQLHCKFGHKDLNLKSSLCEKCGVVVGVTPDTTLLENLYDHLVFAHSDFISKSSVLRMRRLSGDKLSIKKEEEIPKLPQDIEPQDFEAGINRHVLECVPLSVASATEHQSIVESTATPMEPIEETVPSEASLEPSEDNPFSFKIASVMSLAESNESQTLQTSSRNVKSKTGTKVPQLPPLKLVPPLTLISNAPKQQASAQQSLIVKEAKLTTAELGRPKKAPKALQKFIECPGDLYKCPHFYCMFSTNVRTLLISHLKAHKCDSSTMVPCVYCDMKTPWKHVPMHIDIRHASSKYSCSYCLYRATFKEYVCLHQEQSHPDLEFVIVGLPGHKAAKKFSVADPKTDYKVLCEPYRCICKEQYSGQLEVHEYLFDTEFLHHLTVAHSGEYVACGYPKCSSTIHTSLMIKHWTSIHGVNAYQCGYCKINNKDVLQMYSHFSQCHSNLAPDILVRKNIPTSQDRELGYSDEAFRQIYHIKKLPSTILATIGKRAQRSIKLVHLSALSGTPEDSSSPSHVEDPNKGIPPGTSLLFNTTLNNVPTTQSLSPQLLFSKPNLKLIVASTSGSSEKLYLLPASIVSPSKGQSVTSTAPISKAVVQTSTASRAILAQAIPQIPQEPFTLGDITIYPTDGTEVIQPKTKNSQGPLATVSTSSSQPTIAMFPQSLLKTTLPLPAAASENPVTTQAVGGVWSSSKPIVVAKIQSISKVNNDSSPDNERTAGNDSNEPFLDELASENGSTGLSEDDMLQSAIQSILQHEDDSNSSNTRAESHISNNIASAPTSINGSRSGTPGPLPGMILQPPPLVLINSPTTQSTCGKLSVQSQGEVIPGVAPVEHVNVSGNLLEGPFEPGEVDPLNLESNEEFNPEVPFILDSSELDPLSDDTLTTTLASNTDLPSGDPLSVPEAIAIQDPLDVNADINSEAGIQLDTESSREPQKITSMRRSGSIMSNSDEESDSSTSEKKRCGLMGYQLFRCAICNLSFSNVKMFKSHVSSSLTCRKTGPRGFVCVHCEKGLKTCQRLSEHILTHGVPRFSCSLCSEKFTTVGIAKLHMKNRHSINQISFVPMKSDRNNMETDAFVIKPCQPNATSGKDKESTSDSTKPAVEEHSFTPDQLESIPIRQIFSTNVKCGLCNYQTKVRVNIIRHLQMHLDEKAVPDSAPVNPVPCLEKNEKMFDKMINLAASSATTPGRMGGPIKADKEKEDEKYPEFIPSHRRFVCCAQGCSYLCPEEGNLKHHLMALHSDDINFTCAHCKVNIEPSEIENVIKHFKFHGLHLYKCQSCNFFHHLKHKIEKHITDEHPDLGIKVATVRYMEAEPQEFASQEESSAPPQTPVLTKSKRWSCCMCKARYYTREDIVSHITKKHNIDAQYKCTLCAFKNDEEESFKEHFKDTHPNHELDIVFMYRKLEEEVIKEDVGTPFDTTPLWQRDKPRVRHIRGILFDESSPQPTKLSPKKQKGLVGASPKVVVATASKPTFSVSSTATAKVTPSAVDAVSKNVFDCIDAVARGTAEALQNRPGTSGLSFDKKIAVVSSAPVKKVSPPLPITESPRQDQPCEVASIAADDNDPVKSKSQSGNDDVVVVAPAPNIIVIDSDETDTEDKPNDCQSNPKGDEIPQTKDKDSKIKPMAKNRAVKRQATTDLLDKAVKMAKIEEPDDDDYVLATACSQQNLISMYGKFGSPHNKQWMCPKCNRFRSKRVGDFMYHLYKDFSVYRYRCKVCSDLSVTYNYMQDHVRLHPNFTEEFIEKLPPNIKLDTWIHMVIREQSLIILKHAPLFKKRPLTGPTEIMCYFCNDKFMSMPECCEHMLYHWVMMPYQCQHCPHEFYTVYDLKHHHKVEHPDARLYLDPKGPTLSRAIQCIENPKKKAQKPLEVQPKKKPRLDDRLVVTKEDITSGLVINPNKRKKRAKSASSPKAGTSEIISLDDDEDDLVIVSKTDDRVPNDDEVFVCDACVYIADTEVLVIKHLLEVHGIKADKYHILSKMKSKMENVQKLACNVCDQVFSELQLRRHFVEEHLERHTYAPYKFKCNLCPSRFLTLGRMKIHFGKSHLSSQLSYECKVPTSGERKTKCKQYNCTLCAFRTFSSSTVSITAHLKGHLKPVLCNHCNKRFKYESEVLSHSLKNHSQVSPDYVTLNDVMKEYAETMKIIVRNAVLISDNPDSDTASTRVSDNLSANMTKNVAKKSTSTPFLSPKDHSDDEEYSYYGLPQEELDLSNIETTFELDGLEYTTTAEQMMKMFNMDTYVDISDCAVNIIPLDKS